MEENYEFEKATGELGTSLKNDILFHIVMQNNMEALVNLLAALLGIAVEKILNVVVENPIDFSGYVEGKEVILDLKATILGLRTINIEIQVAPYPTWTSRSVYYLSRVLAAQKPTVHFTGLLPVTQISIVDFPLFKDHKEFFGRYRLLNEKDGYLYSDLIEVYVLDLNATDLATPEDVKNGLVTWAKMFKATTWEQIREITGSHPVMKGVAETMYVAVTDAETYKKIEEREKNILDHRAIVADAEIAGRAAGREEGFAEGKEEGRKEGREEGREEGEIIKEIKQVLKKVNKGKTLGEIADELESKEEEIRPVYDVIMQNKSITDPGKIYEMIWKGKIQPLKEANDMN